MLHRCGVSEEEVLSPVGADVSDDIQQLGMLSVYKPDTKAPIGIAKEVKSNNAKIWESCVPAALLVCAARNHRYNYAVHL